MKYACQKYNTGQLVKLFNNYSECKNYVEFMNNQYGRSQYQLITMYFRGGQQ